MEKEKEKEKKKKEKEKKEKFPLYVKDEKTKQRSTSIQSERE